MGRHPSRTRQEVIDVALELVERLGLEALTLRDLGAALGVGHTSVYTHFKDKQDLVDALVAHAASDVVTPRLSEGLGPRSRLCDLALRSRLVFAKHPRLAPALLHASGRVHASHELSRAILTELAQSGLSGRRLIIAYRILENYITGTSIFDFGGAPHHLSTRMARQQAVDPTSFESIATEDDVDALNEEAYMTGFEVLLDGFGVHDS
ncbi:MAG: TetR/AcrR family transcriptional regulator [Actinomycetota bacterium]